MAEQTKKKLGLDDGDFKKLEDANVKLDNIKDKQEVLRKKGDDVDAKKTLAELDGEKFAIWTKEASPILDKVKDKEKKASMYRSLTGNQEINNKAELDDYVKTKTEETKTKPAAGSGNDAKLEKAKEVETAAKSKYDAAVEKGDEKEGRQEEGR